MTNAQQRERMGLDVGREGHDVERRDELVGRASA